MEPVSSCEDLMEVEQQEVEKTASLTCDRLSRLLARDIAQHGELLPTRVERVPAQIESWKARIFWLNALGVVFSMSIITFLFWRVSDTYDEVIDQCGDPRDPRVQ